MRLSTERQKSAVAFCEKILHIEYKGNINDFYGVHAFLSENLDQAKNLYDDMVSDYLSFAEYADDII